MSLQSDCTKRGKQVDEQIAKIPAGGAVCDKDGVISEWLWDRTSMHDIAGWACGYQAAETQSVIDALEAKLKETTGKVFCRLLALRDIRELLPSKGDLRSNGMCKEISGIIQEVLDDEPGPAPEPPENLKSLRESRDMSTDYVDGFLRGKGGSIKISSFESGTFEVIIPGSELANHLVTLYEMGPRRIQGASQQSVREYKAQLLTG